MWAAACALTLTAGVPVAVAAESPPGRGYEMVSPAQKNGNDVGGAYRATADGDAVWYGATSSFAGQPGAILAEDGYVARRSATGWTTTSITPPAQKPATTLADAVTPYDVTEDLTTYVTTAYAGLAGDDQNGVQDVYVHRPGSAPAWLTPATALPDAATQHAWYAGRSRDASTIVVETDKQLLSDVPAGVRRVYAVTDGVPRLVSRLPDGTPTPAAAALGAGLAGTPASGSENYGGPRERRAVSADGSRIVFNSGGTLYLRSGNAPSVPISWSERGGEEGTPGASVVYRSASVDGSRVLFTSTSQLTDGATTGGGLYAYDVTPGPGGKHLTFLSTGSTDVAGARVLGVVRASTDARRVYFAARDALVTGQGSVGGYNLYLADRGTVRFVAALAAGDSPLWLATGTNGGEDIRPARTTDDGSRLLFQTATAIGSAVTGNRQQVYRYDADAGALACVSCRTDGVAPTTAASLIDVNSDAGKGFHQTRNLTADGARAFFETREPLVAADRDTLSDVYEWDGERAQLLSPGADGDDVQYVDNSADGRTVFVRTRAALTAQDTDGGNIDVYAVRTGGGFAEAPATPPCVETACRGPQTPAPVAPVPASLTVSGPGNLPDPPAATPPAVTATRLSASARSRWARTGRVTLPVTLGAAGTIRAVAQAKVGGKATTVAQDAARLRRAGKATLTLRLSRQARRALRRTGSLRLTLTVAASSTTRKATQTVVLRSRSGAR